MVSCEVVVHDERTAPRTGARQPVTPFSSCQPAKGDMPCASPSKGADATGNTHPLGYAPAHRHPPRVGGLRGRLVRTWRRDAPSGAGGFHPTRTWEKRRLAHTPARPTLPTAAGIRTGRQINQVHSKHDKFRVRARPTCTRPPPRSSRRRAPSMLGHAPHPPCLTSPSPAPGRSGYGPSAHASRPSDARGLPELPPQLYGAPPRG